MDNNGAADCFSMLIIFLIELLVGVQNVNKW